MIHFGNRNLGLLISLFWVCIGIVFGRDYFVKSINDDFVYISFSFFNYFNYSHS